MNRHVLLTEQPVEHALLAPSITIVVPTFNERQNIAIFIDDVLGSVSELNCEILFVDDNSPDGTAAEIRSRAHTNSNVRVIQRMREHGLSKSVIDGVQAAMNDIIVVMDADLQHDASIIPQMLSNIESGADVVIGSRFKGGRSAEGLASKRRAGLSRIGNAMLKVLMGRQLTDPLTGFFAVRRELFLNTLRKIEGSGYKILFDLLYCNPQAKVEEIGFTFAPRKYGESKLRLNVLWQFGMQIAERVSHGWLPYRFSSFLCIGAIGAVLHLLTFVVARDHLGADIAQAQIGATLLASLANYTLHNFLTYYDIRKSGMDFVMYFFAYLAISSFGILANISVALVTIDAMRGAPLVGAFAGYFIDIVWKYALANTFVWRERG